jgi:ABC-type nitrate/sulfonate/bicarbonate transport system substrate-binding protein
VTIDSKEDAMTQLRVGTFSPPVVLDVAASTGELEAVGLTVTEHPVASSPAQFRSLLDGELHVALTSPDNVLAYRFSAHNPLQRLLDARIVGAVDRALALGLYGRPGFGADDLRGARVGVDVPTSGFAMALYSLATSLGVSRDEYELVTLGSTPKRLQALLRGECDATMLNAGNELVAEEAGCVRLAGVAERLSPYLGTVVAVVGDQYLAPARRLLRALTTTGSAILAGRLDAEVVEAAQRRLGISESLARRYLDRLRSPADGLVPGGRVDRESIQTLVGLRTTWMPGPADDGDTLAALVAEDNALVGTGLVDAGLAAARRPHHHRQSGHAVAGRTCIAIRGAHG